MVYRKTLHRYILFLKCEPSTTSTSDDISDDNKFGFSDALVDALSDDEWDKENVGPLFRHGTSLRDYVDRDGLMVTWLL